MSRFTMGCLLIVSILLSGVVGFCCGRNLQSESMGGQAVIFQTEEQDSLEQFRKERQNLRQTQISQLNEILHGQDVDAQLLTLAQEKLLELMANTEREMTIENVLNLRGFEDAVVTIHSGSANILIRGNGLSAQQSSVILELVIREIGISAGNVKIIPIN